MSTNGRFLTTKIKTGAVEPLQATGENFYVVSSPVTLQIKFPGGDFGSFGQGTGLDAMPDGGQFDRLEVRNTSLGDITCVIYIGGPLYRDSRQAVIEPDTVPVGQPLAVPAGAIAANSELVLNGIPSGLQIRRKSIQVTNLDANLLLLVKDMANNVVLAVFARTSITLPISKSVKVVNDNGSDMACAVSEIWWTL